MRLGHTSMKCLLSLSGILALGASFIHGCSAGGSASDGGGGSANNGAGANGTGGMAFDGGGDGQLDDTTACVAEEYAGVLAPLDLYVMLDRSSSMEGSYWSAVTSAINTFIGAPECDGIGVGIQYFPLLPPPGAIPPDCSNGCGHYGPCLYNICIGAADTACDAADYDEADVPIAELPGNLAALQTSLSQQQPEGSATPSRPAMEGAVSYATAWAQANPAHLTFIVYATDGDPTGCSTPLNYNTISATAALAADAAAGNPPVKTFVIGVGVELANLHDIAAAGGTGLAYLVDTGGNVTQQFIEALNEIRGMGECQYQIPEPTQGELDYDMVNVSIYDPADREGTEQTIGYVDSEADCHPTEGGWYYDDPANPSKIMLCPASCEQVRLTDWTVSVLIGCETIPI